MPSRSGTWPGLSDLDLEHFCPVAPSSYGPVDAAAALCARLRAPGGVGALGTAAVGSLGPKLAALVLSLSPDAGWKPSRVSDGQFSDGFLWEVQKMVKNGKHEMEMIGDGWA